MKYCKTMPSKIYYLVLFDGKKRGAAAALKSIITEKNANIILQASENPTITRKEDDVSYKILDKFVFQYKNLDEQETITTFIVCQAEKIKE